MLVLKGTKKKIADFGQTVVSGDSMSFQSTFVKDSHNIF